MVETAVYSKNRINLKDYDYKRDIQNRMLMARFSASDIELLEEMICSPMRISLVNLSQQINWSLPDTLLALERLAPTGLFKQEGDLLMIDKEMRKYFEMELVKFEEDFVPGWDFLQSMLKKVPIDTLLSWYPIPRTSNNIFQSLVDRYLKKPQLFQRYLTEIDFETPILNGIKTDLSLAPHHKIYAAEIKEKYNLTEEAFEEAMLYLEFNFICCLSYEKQENGWVEVVTFFQEWKNYLTFIQNSCPKTIHQEIQLMRRDDFPFARDVSTLLTMALSKKIYLELDHKERWVFERQTLPLVKNAYSGFCFDTEEGQELFSEYFSRIVQKLLLTKLVTLEERKLSPSSHAEEWLELSLDKRALNLYKLTLKNYSFSDFPPEICSERIIHDIEKSINRIEHCGWVVFDDFMKGLTVPLSSENKMELEQTGRRWKYKRPVYTSAEHALVKKVIYEWFFEAGIVSIGTCDGRECLSITSFGKTLFAA